MLVISIKYEMNDVWDTISALIHLPKMFYATDYLCKKIDGQFIKDLVYSIFKYYTEDYLQEFSRLNNWASLWSMGPWVNQLPSVWWSIFRSRFLSVSWCVSLIEGFCFWFIASIHVLSNTRFFLLCFLLNHFTLKQFSYAKYFVLSFSIDEVATPANCILIYFLANYHVGWNLK